MSTETDQYHLQTEDKVDSGELLVIVSKQASNLHKNCCILQISVIPLLQISGNFCSISYQNGLHNFMKESCF